TGTRAEFGLMRTVLNAIRKNPKLKLQIVVTGMHLHDEHGRSLDTIRDEGWKIDAVVAWKNQSDPSHLAAQTGLAMAKMAKVFQRLRSDVVLIVGDRVEAFAAAAAGHVSQKIVAHVHGGDRAAGQVDDSLRHAISKLAHVHFAATSESAQRLMKLGEDDFRIHEVGSPGIDGIKKLTVDFTQTFPKLIKRKFALLVLHPMDKSESIETERANAVLSAIKIAGIEQIVVVYPNNDPGSQGIIACWEARESEITYLEIDISRPIFLGLLKQAAILVGNSSSGIIEAANFGTPVVDIGPRQAGRQRSQNVVNVPYSEEAVAAAIKKVWRNGRPKRWDGSNVYGGDGTGRRIAAILAAIDLDDRLKRKLIAY
ncbi:MAG TPA: UDP-N-acetylglucosamine 2-epimerase, partial [Tepidisphaeraceae bacterium]|nr:UDP-N-acetylglucosamine 2-epimerase [Tepidisphaeraceae bacterium]